MNFFFLFDERTQRKRYLRRSQNAARFVSPVINLWFNKKLKLAKARVLPLPSLSTMRIRGTHLTGLAFGYVRLLAYRQRKHDDFHFCIREYVIFSSFHHGIDWPRRLNLNILSKWHITENICAKFFATWNFVLCMHARI